MTTTMRCSQVHLFVDPESIDPQSELNDVLDAILEATLVRELIVLT